MKSSISTSAVKPRILYIFLGSIFLFAAIMFLASCTSSKAKDPEPGLSITSFSPTSGSVGTNIGISGTQFDEDGANNTVSFNGTPGIVGAASKTSLTVVVPDGAGTGPITVTVNGKTVTSSQEFTIVQ